MASMTRRAPLAARTNTAGKKSPAGKTTGLKEKRQFKTVPGRTDTLSSVKSKTSVNKKRKLEGAASSSLKKPARANSQQTGSVGTKKAIKRTAPARLSSDYKGRLDDLTKAHDKLKQAFSEVQLSTEEAKKLNDELNGQVFQLETDLSREKATSQELAEKMKSLEADAEKQRKIDEQLRAELAESVETIELNLRNIAERDATIEDLRSQLSSTQADMKEARSKIFAFDQVRRGLHNQIQDLKGNIRVFCRVRPSKQKCCIDVDQANREPKKLSVVSDTESVSGAKKTKKQNFEFDRVFGPGASQAEIFEEVAHLVQSSLDGYSICIFAYGQTGSGKTYTMEGGSENAEKGIIPRSVNQIFEKASELGKMGWQYTFKASYVEIYNETIRDLLVDPTKDASIKHEVRGDGDVSNVTVVDVDNPSAIHDLLNQALANRSIAKTKMNANSSRSHSVFRLELSGENPSEGGSCRAMLNLVDLAGSERVEKSGATGERLAEANAINKSLSNLGTVISALATKASHVPYRNSKLTHLLQNSLGGNSKCLMLANVSPENDSVSETTCSLRFAARVNSCVIGTATKEANK